MVDYITRKNCLVHGGCTYTVKKTHSHKSGSTGNVLVGVPPEQLSSFLKGIENKVLVLEPVLVRHLGLLGPRVQGSENRPPRLHVVELAVAAQNPCTKCLHLLLFHHNPKLNGVPLRIGMESKRPGSANKNRVECEHLPLGAASALPVNLCEVPDLLVSGVEGSEADLLDHVGVMLVRQHWDVTDDLVDQVGLRERREREKEGNSSGAGVSKGRALAASSKGKR